MYSIIMYTLPPIYRCRACGAVSYQKLTHRGPDGVMRYSGVYRCSGCSITFSDPSAWRERRLRARLDRQGAGAPMTEVPDPLTEGFLEHSKAP